MVDGIISGGDGAPKVHITRTLLVDQIDSMGKQINCDDQATGLKRV